MTKRLGSQIEVTDKEAALTEFELSGWLDCRISAHLTFTEYRGLNFTAPSFVFIDLDLNRFKDLKAFNKALSATLSRIVKVCSQSKPSVLWTGNGYHIYHPLSAFVLEEEQVFADFHTSEVEMSSRFMRFAEEYLTNGKHDPNHKPSIKNCLLRIPGTYNSKNGQQVRIIQEWNGYKTPIQYMLRPFRRYLIQDKIDRPTTTEKPLAAPTKTDSYPANPGVISWIEDLLQTPVSDQRKYCIWRILAPYLVNVKGLSNDSAINIIASWLEECSKLQRISFYSKSRVKDDVRRAKQGGYYPIGYNNLKIENPQIYAIVAGGR